ncbi:MAG: DMT family transporter [Hyphomicrobiaceae bacterium]|nr:DMT family transporter [Hyphomicrobiaceae bacterium]
MTTAAQALTPRPLVGILFMCLAGTLFPVMNGLVQVLSERYSSEQLVWARTSAHLLFVLALFAPSFGIRIVVTTQLGSQIARSILLLMSTTLFFSGVAHLPLAKAASISFTSPFVVVLLAWPMLGEQISLQRLAAVIVAFAGVLIVIRPGSEVFHWASLLILGSATCYAVYQIFTRRVAGHDRPETSVIYSALVGTVVMSGVAAFTWTTPYSWADAVMMLLLGVLGGLGHYCVAKAMTYAPANVVAPFMYWQMVGSVVVGYLVAGSMPDVTTWIGAAIIIGAGLYIGWRDARAKGKTPAPRPV